MNCPNGYRRCNPIVVEVYWSVPPSVISQSIILYLYKKIISWEKDPLSSFTLVFTWYLSFSFMDPGLVGTGHRQKNSRISVLLELSVQLNQRHTQATNYYSLDRISFVKYSHTTRGPQKESGRLCGRLVSHLAGKVFPTFMPGEEGAAGLVEGASGQ